MSEQNKAIVLRFFEEINQGNMNVVDELYADSHRFYQPGSASLDKAARKQLIVQGMVIDRISNSKIREEWANFDLMGLMQQLRAAPIP